MSDQTVTILFRTRAELAGAEAALQATEREIGKLKLEGKAFEEVEEKAKRMRAAIEAAHKPAAPTAGALLNKFREQLSNNVPGFAAVDGFVTKLAGGSLGMVAAGFTAVAGGAKLAADSFKEFSGAQEAVAGLDAALAQTGQLAEPLREHIQELAERMQDLSAIDNGKWIEAITRLIQFGADADNVDKLTDGIKNLAGIMGGDIQGASAILAKAMQGNFSMLSRLGIHIDESRSKAEQLDEALKQIALRGAGQLEARGESLAGTVRKISAGFSDLLKVLGQLLFGSETTQDSLHGFADFLTRLAGRLSGPIDKIKGLSNAATSTALSLDDATTATTGLATAQTSLATAIGNVEGAWQRQIQAIDAGYQRQVTLLEKQKNLEKAKVLLTERDPEKAARANAGIDTAFGDAQNLLSGKAAKDKGAVIDQEMNRTRRDVGDVNDELQQLKNALPLVQKYRTDEQHAKETKSQIEKEEERLAGQEKARSAIPGPDRFNPTRGAEERAQANKEIAEQRDYIAGLRKQLAEEEARAKNSLSAIPGVGLGANKLNLGGNEWGTLEDLIKKLETQLNELVGRAVPRMDDLQRQKDQLFLDDQSRNAGRAIDRKTEGIKGQQEIRKGREQNDQRLDHDIDLFNRGGIPSNKNLQHIQGKALSAINESSELTAGFLAQVVAINKALARKVIQQKTELAQLQGIVETKRLA